MLSGELKFLFELSFEGTTTDESTNGSGDITLFDSNRQVISSEGTNSKTEGNNCFTGTI